MKNVYSFYLQIFFFSYFTSQVCAQVQHAVDFETIDAKILINPFKKVVEGKVQLQFRMIKKADTVFLDARNFENVSWLDVPKKIKLQLEKQRILFIGKFNKNKTYNLAIQYKTTPKKCMYFVGWDNNAPNQVWTQGQGKYTSHWLPSIDDMRDKILFHFSIIAPKGYRTIANGNLYAIEQSKSHTKWSYRMKQPMSSYLAAIAIGKYREKNISSSSGVDIHLYYYPEDKNKVETTYAYTKEIFDFFETYIGVPYPWQNYKQIPVFDFLYAGMENVGTTIFSDRFVVDSTGFNDENYIQVNAHEMAHQWFGNLVTETQSTEHWLHEGFATYYSWLAEAHLFGETHYYYRIAEALTKLQQAEQRNTLKPLVDGTASSLVFYEKGALALHVLREKVGEEIFRTGVQNFLTKYAYKNVRIKDFLKEMEAVCNCKLDGFKKEQLETATLNSESILATFKPQQTFLKNLQLAQTIALYTHAKEYDKAEESLSVFLSNLQTQPYYQFYDAAIVALSQNYDKETSLQYKRLLKHPNLALQKAIVRNINDNTNYYFEYLKKFKLPSYELHRELLRNLWKAFPDKRKELLRVGKNIPSYKRNNFYTILWHSLYVQTQPEVLLNKKSHQNSKNILIDYTKGDQSFYNRLYAFEQLHSLKYWPSEAVINLLESCSHHAWRYTSEVRRLTKLPHMKKTIQEVYPSIEPKLSKAAKNYYNKHLKVKN